MLDALIGEKRSVGYGCGRGFSSTIDHPGKIGDQRIKPGRGFGAPVCEVPVKAQVFALKGGFELPMPEILMNLLVVLFDGVGGWEVGGQGRLDEF